MLLILNSAVMVRDGSYKKTSISSLEAKELFLEYKKSYISYIGYGNVANILSKLFTKNIEVNRDKTKLGEGDLILAVQLKYRVAPKGKREVRDVKLEDLLFSKITYRS